MVTLTSVVPKRDVTAVPVSVAETVVAELLEDEVEELLLEEVEPVEGDEPVLPDEAESDVPDDAEAADESVLLEPDRLEAVTGWESSTPAGAGAGGPRTRGARRMEGSSLEVERFVVDAGGGHTGRPALRDHGRGEGVGAAEEDVAVGQVRDGLPERVRRDPDPVPGADGLPDPPVAAIDLLRDL